MLPNNVYLSEVEKKRAVASIGFIETLIFPIESITLICSNYISCVAMGKVNLFSVDVIRASRINAAITTTPTIRVRDGKKMTNCNNEWM